MFARQIGRKFSTSLARTSSHGPEGFPGANIPFGINNRYKLLLGFTIFFGTGVGAPYVLMAYQMMKD